MTLYLKVTNDKYELPVAVADSVGELARMLNMSTKTLHSTFSRIRHGATYKTYIIVNVDEEEG